MKKLAEFENTINYNSSYLTIYDKVVSLAKEDLHINM